MKYLADSHIWILISIIVLIGTLAGFINYLKDGKQDRRECFRYILTAIGASILVPLLLNMLSSNLIKYAQNFDNINYFVFAGFCFVAGYFSDRFINSIADRILKDLEETKESVEAANERVDEAFSSVKETEEKVNFIVSAETENGEIEMNALDLESLSSQSSLVDYDTKLQTNKLIKSFSGKYKFRTIKGIAKELGFAQETVEAILQDLLKSGITRKNGRGDKELWALTNVGLQMLEKLPD